MTQALRVLQSRLFPHGLRRACRLCRRRQLLGAAICLLGAVALLHDTLAASAMASVAWPGLPARV